MQITLLIDFGSTFTKVVAIDIKNEEIIGIAQSSTTVESNIMVGLERAISKLGKIVRINDEIVEQKFACSSAAGGLRMIVTGLVPSLTAEAAKRAALGSGAKVLKTYSFALSYRELKEIEMISPDIILLSGGTDGGDSDTILHNARVLAESELNVPIIVAGNKAAADEVESILSGAGKFVKVTENVMPEIDSLNEEPARSEIRRVFMHKIIEAKGLDKAKELVDNILMPTPMAVLYGARLLSQGTTKENGIGDLMVLDVGGATTDVHSLSFGRPTGASVVCKGLPEPYAKRTVEGDLGIRYNAPNILEIAGEDLLRKQISIPNLDIEEATKKLSKKVGLLPETLEERMIDVGLARAATEIAVKRHVGRIEFIYTPMGQVALQYGKDLTDLRTVIGTGGIFAYSESPQDRRKILEGALFCNSEPLYLRPKDPEFYVDNKYILFAIGLLSSQYPDQALRIMKMNLKKLEA